MGFSGGGGGIGVTIENTPSAGETIEALSATTAEWVAAGGTGTVTSVTAADPSITVSGTPTIAPVLATSTLDVIAANHTTDGNIGMNGFKLTGLANGSAASDSAAFGQIPGLPVSIANGGTGQITGAGALAALGGAPLVSPVFTGIPAAPTGTPGDTSTQIATDAFVAAALNAAIQGLAVKPSVQEATATALPANTYSNGASGVGATLTAVLPGVLTVDGIAVTLGSRVLVQDEAAAANNGIYVMTTLGTVSVAYVLTRATDMNQTAEVPGAFVFTEAGTVNGGAGFTVAGAGPYTIGTTAINWTQFSGAGEITAGAGLTKTGNVLSLTGPTLALQATTGTTGYALVNGTGNILTWTAPNDGLLHRVQIIFSVSCTSGTTGGLISVTWTAPDGSTANSQMLAAGLSPGSMYRASSSAPVICKAGTAVSLTQYNAMTAGAATLWGEIWGS
jgi:hypothetical protein